MTWSLRTTSVADGRTAIMGILNVTPDSFSDGGVHLDPARAVAAGIEMVAAGADLVDVGGESTRPGSQPVTTEEELRRVLPVVDGLARAGVLVSIDTTKSEVARAALELGAEVVNDTSALSDPAMEDVVRTWRPGLAVMHMQGSPATMQADPVYTDVVGEVREFLVAAARTAERWGSAPGQIAIDPGIGFGKTLQHNLALLAATDVLAATGYPVLVGPSRKGFLGTILGLPDPTDREIGTAAAATAAIVRGAKIVRVHNVSVIRQAALVADAIVASERGTA